jgi:predicted nicotinamide N-methyase
MAHRAMPANASFNDAMAAADRRLNLLGLEIVTVRAAGRDFEITAVSDQDRLLAAASELEVFPFGLLLWEAGVVMADVVGEAWPLGAVLELGAGAGLGGLVAAALGAKVLQTDHSAEALALCRRNAEANGIAAIEQSFGDWTDWHHEGRYDCVIGADILYEPALYRDIVRVLERAVAPGGRVILTDPARSHAAQLVEDLRSRGWVVEVEARRVPALPPCQPFETVRVDVIRASRD